MATANILEVENLSIGASAPDSLLVENVSFTLPRGASLGLVGESGSGKSLLAMALMRILPWPQLAIRSGSIRFEGLDLAQTPESQLKTLRGRALALVLQDALASLNPVRRLGSQLAEIFEFHADALPAAAREPRIREVLRGVGLEDGPGLLQQFPQELSGGMRQRFMLAMAVLLRPRLLIADEPTTSLDVRRQAQIVQLLQDLQKEGDLSLIFISHDIGLVAELCKATAVIYRGQLLECGLTQSLLTAPLHPYTRAMMAALPIGGRAPLRRPLQSEFAETATACLYAAHCPLVIARCRAERPHWRQVDSEHGVACHRAEELRG